MKNILKDEQGVTLVELIATLAVFLVVLFFFGMIMSSLSKGYAIQSRQVKLQQMANDMVVQMIGIVNKEGIYEKAGYLGKFKTDSVTGKSSWQTDQVVVVFDPDRSDLKTFDWTEPGTNKIAITDILDASKSNGKIYRLPNHKSKVKIFQHKNKNESLKTQFESPNYRDTFTIQNSVTILFYEGDIDFNKYVEADGETINLSGANGIEEKEAKKILYIRNAELTYRDEKKAKGEIPGEGRW
jgi:hypothetical protein